MWVMSEEQIIPSSIPNKCPYFLPSLSTAGASFFFNNYGSLKTYPTNSQALLSTTTVCLFDLFS